MFKIGDKVKLNKSPNYGDAALELCKGMEGKVVNPNLLAAHTGVSFDGVAYILKNEDLDLVP